MNTLDTISFFKTLRETIDSMSDEDAGALMKALFAHDDGEEVDLSGKSVVVRVVYPFVSETTDKLKESRLKKSAAGRAKRNTIGTSDEQERNTDGTQEEQKRNKTGTEAEQKRNTRGTEKNTLINYSPLSPIETIEEREVKEREINLSKEKQEKVSLPDTGIWADEEVRKAFAEYAKMRIRLRKAMTPEAVKRKIPQLERLTDDPQEAVELIHRATDNCWLDFYPDRDKRKKPPDKPVFNFDQRGTDYDALLRNMG